ncbi:TPA: LysR family transcriptional regulator, partial [Vibrio diabolicus]
MLSIISSSLILEIQNYCMEIKWLSYVPLYVALCEERSIAGAAKR